MRTLFHDIAIATLFISALLLGHLITGIGNAEQVEPSDPVGELIRQIESDEQVERSMNNVLSVMNPNHSNR